MNFTGIIFPFDCQIKRWNSMVNSFNQPSIVECSKITLQVQEMDRFFVSRSASIPLLEQSLSKFPINKGSEQWSYSQFQCRNSTVLCLIPMLTCDISLFRQPRQWLTHNTILETTVWKMMIKGVRGYLFESENIIYM